MSVARLYKVALVPLGRLRAHEMVEPQRVEKLVEDIRRRGRVERPVLVDVKTLVILDGHHRVAALRRLGARCVPAVLVDYSSPCVEVGSWRPGLHVDKATVLRAGLEGKPLPPRTSRHQVCFEIPRADTPLEELL